MPYERINITLESDVTDKARKLGEIHKRTVSNLIAWLIVTEYERLEEMGKIKG